MRSLVVTRLSPFPPMAGVPLRVAAIIHALAEFGPVDVLIVGDEPRQEPPSYVSHVESFVVPKPGRLAKNLRRFGATHPLAAELHLTEVEKAIGRHGTGPGIVVLSEVWMAPYLSAARKTGRAVVYDSHNVETVLRRQIAADRDTGSIRRLRLGVIEAQINRLEGQLVREADQSWVCSGADRQMLVELFGRQHGIHVVPNAADVDGIREAIQGVSDHVPEGVGRDDKSVIFLGDLAYEPNNKGALFLQESVMPEVRKRIDDVNPVYVGRRPTDRLIASAGNDPAAVVTGEVDSVMPYLAHGKVLAVTLLTGGGTRLKIVEAMAAGLPIVTTTKGLEGIDAVHGEHLLVADEPAAIAEAIVDVLRNPDAAALRAERAGHLVDESYSWATVARLVSQGVSELPTGR